MILIEKILEFELTNNQAEYKAFIFGLEALWNVVADKVTVYGDSILVIKQVSKEWEIREGRMRLYWDFLATILLSFTQCKFIHFPREENQVADTLATLASL